MPPSIPDDGLEQRQKRVSNEPVPCLVGLNVYNLMKLFKMFINNLCLIRLLNSQGADLCDSLLSVYFI